MLSNFCPQGSGFTVGLIWRKSMQVRVGGWSSARSVSQARGQVKEGNSGWNPPTKGGNSMVRETEWKILSILIKCTQFEFDFKMQIEKWKYCDRLLVGANAISPIVGGLDKISKWLSSIWHLSSVLSRVTLKF